MYSVLFRKEILEQVRTSKLLAITVVLFICGLISPLLAKYTPLILQSIPDLPEALAGVIPEPTVADSIGQYVKNVSQFGVLLAVLFNMGVVAQEKERGTAAMLLVKPVERQAMILSKWLAAMIVVAAGLFTAGIAEYLYTAYLFESLNVGRFLILNLFLTLFLVVYLTAAIMASSMARTQTMAAWTAFGALALLLILSSIPWISDFMPGALLNWGSQLAIGIVPEPAWGAVIVSVVLIIVMLAAAILKFQREEI